MTGQAARHAALERLDIRNGRHTRIATEGALLGAALASGIDPEPVIVGGDAGQFGVLIRAPCWSHVERGIHKLRGFDEAQRAALDWTRGELWAIYQARKAEPTRQARAKIEVLCTAKTCFESLDRALGRLHRSSAELLRARAPRTRSEAGRRCRDIFASLKKRWPKRGILLWISLRDRLGGADTIPWLPSAIFGVDGERAAIDRAHPAAGP